MLLFVFASSCTARIRETYNSEVFPLVEYIYLCQIHSISKENTEGCLPSDGRLSFAFVVSLSPSFPVCHKETAFLILTGLCGYVDGPELIISYFSVISHWKSHIEE